MRLLVNENMGRPVIEALRLEGHDVLWARDVLRGQPDEVVLERAAEDKRLLLTYDKDFGELAYRVRLPAECGIVLFRLELMGRDASTARIVGVLGCRDDWSGHFAVVTETQVRIRRLPSGPSPEPGVEP